ncbi:MAG: HD domain-containing protein [Candidatus Omnitrophica bacterium]|nr:HD domain-containing protein [Candidatus Omnitrophota bacterium]
MAYVNDSSKKAKPFDLLLENSGYKDLRTAFDKLLLRPLWWLAEKGKSSRIKPFLRTQRARDMEDYLSLSDYKKTISKSIRQAERSKAPVLFEHPVNNTYGICVPLVKDEKTFGFFGICALKAKPRHGTIDVLSGYTHAIIDEISKDLELGRVYELVRPRAIALSTVHTINRLVTSILDIKELFPRIARLTLQILKAERVRICMVDKYTGALGCVAAVDYRKSKDLFKIRTKPSPTECKVVQSGRSVKKSNFLCVPLVDEEMCGTISVRDKVGKKEKFSIFDREILTTLAEQAVIAIKNAQIYKEQEDLTIGTIKSLGYLLDAKFPRAYTHTEFFVELMVELGKALGLTKKELKILHYSALLPDLGKVVMPEEILRKTKALSGKERKILKTHTVRGIEVLKYLDVLKPVVPIILHHHERYDGTGYPERLKAKDIPLGSRIMAVVDAFEAMVCHRPYRKPLPFRMAVSEIRRQAGKQFDPEVVKAFIRIVKIGRLEELVRKHPDELKKIT